MAYDKQKAHEYYKQYRKKGLKKGRTKGTGKKKTGAKVKKTNLLGQTTSGLNDSGRIQAALVKEKMTAEMNAALAKATTQEEKDAIRVEYSQKAQEQIASLKNDPKYAQAKKESAKGSKGSKGSTRKKSSGGSSSSKSSGGNSSTDTTREEKKKKRKAKIQKIKETVQGLEKALSDLPETQKANTREIIKNLLSRLSALRG